MKNKSVSQHAFALVPSLQKPRSVFSRDHSYKTTFDADYLIPVYFQNVLPGDTVNLQHSVLVRMNSPLIRPVMDNMHLAWFYFFVPYRLVWANFQKFMGEQLSPADSISYTVPQCTGPNVAALGIPVGSLHDYFGLPVGPLSGGGGTTGITFDNLWLRAYNKIYMDWMKDQNLQNAVTLDTGDGPDTFSNYNLLKRGKRHDYFTSALPNLQKGSAVTMPLGTYAPVVIDPASGGGIPSWRNATDTDKNLRSVAASPTPQWDLNPTVSANMYWDRTALRTDLTAATSSSINVFRQSVALQQFLENDARSGTRYPEILRSRWGVISPDARLFRAEILSLGESPIKINVVAATAETEVTELNSIGRLAGFGTASDVGNGFSKSFVEHGVIIGLLSVRADLTYSQGLERHWSYRTRYDFANPEFMNLGEQSILNKEIYADIPDGTGAAQKDGVFGYQERNAEERYSHSLVTGLMRPYVTDDLSVYNLSEEFTSQPTLGATFIQSSAIGPIDRAIAVPSQPQFIVDIYYRERWARVMPTFSVPGLTKL